MTNDSSDSDSPVDSDTNDVTPDELARIVVRQFDPTESVSEDELRTALQSAIEGTIVDLTPGDTEITVIVEQPPSEEGETVRDAYAVRRSTDIDGEPALEWSYLGPANR